MSPLKQASYLPPEASQASRSHLLALLATNRSLAGSPRSQNHKRLEHFPRTRWQRP